MTVKIFSCERGQKRKVNLYKGYKSRRFTI